MRKPPPETQLPGIVDTLKDLAPGPANLPSIALRGRVESVVEPISNVSRPGSRPPDTEIKEKTSDKEEVPTIANIYARRADQIGVSHRLLGIGHLGDLLPPPGWKQGNDPINEAEAETIFANSRFQAKVKLDRSMSEASHLSSADQEKLRAEENARYQTQRLLDEYLLLERAKLYKFWQERQQKVFHEHNSQQRHVRIGNQPMAHPQPLQPHAETSMIAYQRHQQSLVPASPHLYGPSPPVSGGTLNARIRFMQQGMIDVTRDCNVLQAEKVLHHQGYIYPRPLQ